MPGWEDSNMQPPKMPSPHLDAVVKALKAASKSLEHSVWELTHNNALDASDGDPTSWILQVPDCWGTVDNKAPQPGPNPGVKALLAKMRSNISAAQYCVDITGFGSDLIGAPVGAFPDGAFLEAIDRKSTRLNSS